jgi:hypothetical protein
MKRLALTLIAGAFGSLLVLPVAHAQDWEDMNQDANRIYQQQRNIGHDRWELREDLERGDLGAAAREQEEINERRADQNATREDLNNDWANRNYGGYGYRYYHHDDDDD